MGLFDWLRGKRNPPKVIAKSSPIKPPQAAAAPKVQSTTPPIRATAAAGSPKAEAQKSKPPIVELPSIESERAYLQRINCSQCGGPTQATRNGSGSSPDGRMHDFYTVRCPKCNISQELVLSVPGNAGLASLQAMAGEDATPDAKALFQLLGSLMKEQAMPQPVERRPKKPDANFLYEYLDQTDLLYNDDLQKILASDADPATKRERAFAVKKVREDRQQAALDFAKSMSDESKPAAERMDLQMKFNGEHAIKLSFECYQRGLDK